jgi:hypothetical protein
MKIVLTLFVLFFSSSVVADEDEISLLNSSGDAVVYIDLDDDDLAIYTWDGDANAYLHGSLKDFLLGKTIDVYG